MFQNIISVFVCVYTAIPMVDWLMVVVAAGSGVMVTDSVRCDDALWAQLLLSVELFPGLAVRGSAERSGAASLAGWLR